MPLFACRKCRTIDNTALARAWKAWDKSEHPLCTECSTGTWHEEFPKQSADERFTVEGKVYRWRPDEQGGVFPGRVEAEDISPTSVAGQAVALAEAKRRRRAAKNMKRDKTKE